MRVVHTCMHTYSIHAYIHTYIHTCMHAYIHTYNTYIHTRTEDEQRSEHWSGNSWSWNQGYEDEDEVEQHSEQEPWYRSWVPTRMAAAESKQNDTALHNAGSLINSFFQAEMCWACQSFVAQTRRPIARLFHGVQASRTWHFAPANARSLTQLLPFHIPSPVRAFLHRRGTTREQ